MQKEQQANDMFKIYFRTFQVLKEPIMTVQRDSVIEVANSQFLRFLIRSSDPSELHGDSREVTELLTSNEEKGLFQRSKDESLSLLSLKLFRVYRDYAEEQTEKNNDELSAMKRPSKKGHNQKYSFSDLIQLGADFTHGKIFESVHHPNEPDLSGSDEILNAQEQAELQEDLYRYFSFNINYLGLKDS